MGDQHDLEGNCPTIVHLLDILYEKGIKVPLPELETFYLPFWQRSETLPKSDVTMVST